MKCFGYFRIDRELFLVRFVDVELILLENKRKVINFIFLEFGYMMVYEMTGYFFGILANSMLILCINTAKYKVSMINLGIIGVQMPLSD